MKDFAGQKYNIIYADPPWKYRVWSKKGSGRSAESHYSTMCTDDICKLPISDIAAKDCALFIWGTYPNLIDTMKVIPAWGFSYKTCAFTWVKRNKRSPSWFWGMGYWTRANAEVCLLATRGSIKRASAGVHQIIDTPIERHSKKPDVVRDRIVTLMGDLPRIELFAREQTPGWDSWGNEIGGGVSSEA